MKVYNTQKLIVNCWSRIPIDFTVKLKYTNSASNNEYPFSITPPQANITKQVFEIVLIEGTIQSVSILANTPMILRGHTFFQCWVCDFNSQIPIHILFSDYLTSAKPIGFPFTGIQDNGYDIENGLLINDFISLNGLSTYTLNFNNNTLVKLEEVDLSMNLPLAGGNANLTDALYYYDLYNFTVIGQPVIQLFPLTALIANAHTQIQVQRNAATQVLQTGIFTINSYRLYEVPIFPNTTVSFGRYTIGLSGNIFGNKNYLQVSRKELINIV